MYRYVRADIDVDDVTQSGLESMWNNATDRSTIVNEVRNMSSRDIVDALEDKLDDDTFKAVMLALASETVH